MKKTTEEKYQEFKEIGYDHQTARELALLASEKEKKEEESPW